MGRALQHHRFPTATSLGALGSVGKSISIRASVTGRRRDSSSTRDGKERLRVDGQDVRRAQRSLAHSVPLVLAMGVRLPTIR